MAGTSLSKARQRLASFRDALSYLEDSRYQLGCITLAALREGDGWRLVVDAMIVQDTAIAALKYALGSAVDPPED